MKLRDENCDVNSEHPPNEAKIQPKKKKDKHVTLQVSDNTQSVKASSKRSVHEGLRPVTTSTPVKPLLTSSPDEEEDITMVLDDNDLNGLQEMSSPEIQEIQPNTPRLTVLNSGSTTAGDFISSLSRSQVNESTSSNQQSTTRRQKEVMFSQEYRRRLLEKEQSDKDKQQSAAKPKVGQKIITVIEASSDEAGNKEPSIVERVEYSRERQEENSTRKDVEESRDIEDENEGQELDTTGAGKDKTQDTLSYVPDDDDEERNKYKNPEVHNLLLDAFNRLQTQKNTEKEDGDDEPEKEKGKKSKKSTLLDEEDTEDYDKESPSKSGKKKNKKKKKISSSEESDSESEWKSQSSSSDEGRKKKSHKKKEGKKRRRKISSEDSDTDSESESSESTPKKKSRKRKQRKRKTDKSSSEESSSDSDSDSDGSFSSKKPRRKSSIEKLFAEFLKERKNRRKRRQKKKTSKKEPKRKHRKKQEKSKDSDSGESSQSSENSSDSSDNGDLPRSRRGKRRNDEAEADKYKAERWKRRETRRTRHKSHCGVDDVNYLPAQQAIPGYCVLCPKKFVGVNRRMLVAHNNRVHFAHSVVVDSTRVLMCKCSAVPTRGYDADARNAHFHCPGCHKPCDKRYQLGIHLVSRHNYTDEEVAHLMKNKNK